MSQRVDARLSDSPDVERTTVHRPANLAGSYNDTKGEH